MKRLVRNGRELEFFFDSNVTLEQVKDWVYLEIEKLDPNEAHSCEVEIIDNSIWVSGDEDQMELTLIDVKTIVL